jgi:hypothetical protein
MSRWPASVQTPDMFLHRLGQLHRGLENRHADRILKAFENYRNHSQFQQK